jgi:hypothetical protein
MPGHRLWSYGIREIKEKDNTSLKFIRPWFLRCQSYVNGLKEVPRKNSISIVLIEIMVKLNEDVRWSR